MDSNKKSSSNVLRAAEILMALGDASPAGLTLAELAANLSDAKSAVHRALVALAQYGLVDQSGRRGTYRIGPAVYALANKPHSIADLVKFYRPALIGISAETGLSSYLMVRSGLDSVCLDFEIGTAPVQALFDGIGGRLPLGVGLGGVTVLAQMDAKSRDKIIEVNAGRYPRWDVGAETIYEEIKMVQDRGYVVGKRKTNQNLLTIAFPAERAGSYDSQASISLLGSAQGMTEGMIAAIVEKVKAYLEGLATNKATEDRATRGAV